MASTARLRGVTPSSSVPPLSPPNPLAEMFPASWAGWSLLDEIADPLPSRTQVFDETAAALHRVINEEIRVRYSRDWGKSSICMSRLRQWVAERLGKAACKLLQHQVNAIKTKKAFQSISQGAQRSMQEKRLQEMVRWTPEDTACWQDIACAKLAQLRVTQLYDIITMWPRSRGAIEDLRLYLSPLFLLPSAPSPHNGINPENDEALRRYHAFRTRLVHRLQKDLVSRLLHPGSSTSQILRHYINMIHALAALEPSLVLLQRVTDPLRTYLRDREDTVKVIVTGLLSEGPHSAARPLDAEDDDEYGETLHMLAEELLASASRHANSMSDLSDLEGYADMSWEPTPKDAPPGYKRNRNGGEEPDVIGQLISLYDTRELFVGELQNIMGERLLRPGFHIGREKRLLELLKVRFGENAIGSAGAAASGGATSTGMQACEVMVRDIEESALTDRNLTRAVRQNEGLHAKILSRLYWPNLMTEDFKIPAAVKDALDVYEQGFAQYKHGRRLQWIKSLGQVEIYLELEDRTIEIHGCHTWQAAVIYAFEEDEENQQKESKPVSRTVQQLEEVLEMDETLLRTALAYWVGKFILRETKRDHYTVVERLNSLYGSKGASMAQHAAMAEVEAAEAEEELMEVGAVDDDEEHEVPRVAEKKKDEKIKMYEQFVVSMLTNHGASDLGKVVMMLKMVMPGMAMGQEEIKDMLGDLVVDGQVEVVGGKYKMKG